MEELEDSTLALIHKRQVRSRLPAYVLIFFIAGALTALPLVKVDVVTSVKGMVRPVQKPVEIISSVSGRVEKSELLENRSFHAGDTLVWFKTKLLNAQIDDFQKRIKIHQKSVADIQLILDTLLPRYTSHYKQSYRNHLSALSGISLEKEFLHRDFQRAEILFKQEVIALFDFESAQSRYRNICARERELRESYRSQLEEDLHRIHLEIGRISEKINLSKSSLDEYYLLAPVSGTVYNSRGLSAGAVVHAGMILARISPSGFLAAECYLDPGQMASIKKGSKARLRFDDTGFRTHVPLETEVDLLDKEVSLHNGFPYYRIRCTLDGSPIHYANGSMEPVKNGMTFTASFILFRRSLAALILDKANLWIHPTESTFYHETGS